MLLILFVIVPFVIACIPILAVAEQAWLAGKEKQRRIELHEAKIKEAHDRAEERAQRAIDATAVRETRIAEAHNKTMLMELKIELEALKIAKQRKDMGFDAPDFNPKDYAS